MASGSLGTSCGSLAWELTAELGVAEGAVTVHILEGAAAGPQPVGGHAQARPIQLLQVCDPCPVGVDLQENF